MTAPAIYFVESEEEEDYSNYVCCELLLLRLLPCLKIIIYMTGIKHKTIVWFTALYKMLFPETGTRQKLDTFQILYCNRIRFFVLKSGNSIIIGRECIT